MRLQHSQSLGLPLRKTNKTLLNRFPQPGVRRYAPSELPISGATSPQNKQNSTY